MSEFSYGWEKLHVAVHSLAGAASQKERLVGAVVFSLIHINPDVDLPEKMRDEFKQFMQEITSVAAMRDEGTVQATIDTYDELALSRAVEKIIGFYDEICHYRGGRRS